MAVERSHEERLHNLQLYLAAAERGDDEEAHRIAILTPLAPELALCAKELYGAAYVRSTGYDLSLAEAAYGNDWLER